jgi:hypothetical protein
MSVRVCSVQCIIDRHVLLCNTVVVSHVHLVYIYNIILCYLVVVTTECHYDGTPNFVASIGGLRRWIMLHPSQCSRLHLLERNSTSSRHSGVDWSAPDYAKYTGFQDALANELILRPGDVLFVPGLWFHFIVSLNVNFQCNARTGSNNVHYRNLIRKCGKF